MAVIQYGSTLHGGELLVRVESSLLYKLFTYIGHEDAILITVDSLVMKIKLKDLLNLDSEVVQKGILIEHLKLITRRMEEPKKDYLILIWRIAENYQVLEIIDCCNGLINPPLLQLCCLFYSEERL